MKDIIVKHYEKIEPEVNTQNGNSFAVKNIIPPDMTDKCCANFVEVEPGNFAYGYHYHEENEEIFYIISGKASVKTLQGEIFLTQGDVICFPANENGSHVISNPSKDEKLLYLDIGTANKPDVVHFTGTNQGMVITKNEMYKFSK